MINKSGKERKEGGFNGKKKYRLILNSVKSAPLSQLGLLIILLLIISALFAPYIAPFPKDAQGEAMNFSERLKPPSLTHPFGTDALGRDILSRVIFGSRLSLLIGLSVVIFTAGLGVILGSVAGYFGEKFDDFIMRVADMLMAIPYVLMVIAIVSAIGPGISNLIIAISLPWWPWYARVVRSEVLHLKEQDFVEASRALGASHRRLLFKHIFPNFLNVVIVQASLQIGKAVLAAAAMGFLGIGVQPPRVEWGLMISTGRRYMPTQWWMACFPGAAIFVTVLGFNLFGDGLRDILDPHKRTHT